MYCIALYAVDNIVHNYIIILTGTNCDRRTGKTVYVEKNKCVTKVIHVLLVQGCIGEPKKSQNSSLVSS
jgi:hypothetical protein